MLPANPVLKLLMANQGLTLERSGCVQHRYKATGCDRCFKICPTGAISWTDNGLHWEQAACQRCMLCVAACPTGALLAKDLPLVHRLKLLAVEKKPVLACSAKPSTAGHVRLPCLGLLSSPELLLAFSLALGKPYQLNLLACSECSNVSMLPRLKAAAAQVADISAYAVLVEDESKLEFKERGVSRREFFSLVRHKTEVRVCSLADQLHDIPDRSFGDKSIPPQRLLLMQLLKRLPAEERSELVVQLFPRVEISTEACSGCTGCVGLCPTGALLPPRVAGEPPTVHAQNCTECGLCTAFCPSGSIRIVDGKLGRMAVAVHLASLAE